MLKLASISAVCVALILGSIAASQAKDDASIAWTAGTWQKTVDEDNGPPESITFKKDGTWISYGPEKQQLTNPFHLYRGDIYLTIEMQGKGPMALVFRPSKDRTKLVFTSPRTFKNATYERVGNGGNR